MKFPVQQLEIRGNSIFQTQFEHAEGDIIRAGTVVSTEFILQESSEKPEIIITLADGASIK